MNRTINPKTENAVNERQKQDFCYDCDRYKAFCRGKRNWFDDNDYWVCTKCIQNGRPEQEQEEQNEQQSILQFINEGDSQ